MTARRLLPVALLTTVALALAGAERASACSCADSDPRDRIEQGTPAMIGRVVSAPPRNPTPPLRLARYLCSLVKPGELERATRPYPRPLGRGRLALLAAGAARTRPFCNDVDGFRGK